MGNGVGNQTHPAFPGNLLHDLGLAHTRRADEQQGPLADGWDGIAAQLVLGEIGLEGVFDLLFCALDIHKAFLSWVSGRGLAAHWSG